MIKKTPVLYVDKKDCCGCSACAVACPKSCIHMVEDAEGFWYPQIDEEQCIGCQLCKKSCPIPNETTTETIKEPYAYAVMNLDEDVRVKSSSGGAFSLLAEDTLNKGGVVFGAKMSDDLLNVVHVAIEKVEGLSELRGSKYLQSQIGDTYKQAKTELDNGREVLFSGTPCQIEGLKSYLKKDYSNLLCVDIICHGVPSHKVWKKYLQYCEKKAKATASQVSFRNKTDSWQNFSMWIKYSNNKEQRAVLYDDYYLETFLKNVCLRPSCANCHYKKINRISDITLADFWGIEKVLPEMNDNKGTSLVLLHSEKGKNVFHQVQNKMKYHEVSLEMALKGNKAMTQSAVPNKNRGDFFDNIEAMSFKQLISRYVSEPLSIKRVVKRVLKKTGLLKKMKR